jgi:protein-disulfide isomerase
MSYLRQLHRNGGAARQGRIGALAALAALAMVARADSEPKQLPTTQPAASAPTSAPTTQPLTWRQVVREVRQETRHSMIIRADDTARGSSKPRDIVVVFSDFADPRCRAFNEFWSTQVWPHVRRWTMQVYRYFPLDPTCNPLVHQQVDPRACEMARLAEAARQIGGIDAFWKMHDALFALAATPPDTPIDVAKLAKQCGISAEALRCRQGSPLVRERIQHDLGLAQQIGVHELPAVYLNGRRVRHWNSFDFWERLLVFRELPPPDRPTTQPATTPSR